MDAGTELRSRPAGCCVPAVRDRDRGRARRDAGVHAALGDEVRLTMLRLLAREPALCVCEIQRAFPLRQPTISHHLRVLREAGLVRCQKRGLWAYYSLERGAVRRLAEALQELL